MNEFKDVQPSSLTGHFAYGKRFAIVRYLPGDRYLVEDDAGHALAALSREVGGEVRTSNASWQIRVERRGHTWAILACNPADGIEAGGAIQRLIPNTYKLWVGAEDSWRLSQNPLSGNWKLTGARHTRLADLEPKSIYGRLNDNFSLNRPRLNVGWLTTAESRLNTTDLALPIVLALEMINAKASILLPDVYHG